MWRRMIFQMRARVLRASSLPARNGLAGGGLVGSIFRGRYCVCPPCLCLPRLRERSEQRSGDFGIARLGGVAALNIQRLVYRPSDVAWDAPPLHTLSSFSVTPQRRRPSAYKRPVLWMTSSQSSYATLRWLQVISKQLCTVACWMLWHSRSCSPVDSHRAEMQPSNVYNIPQRLMTVVGCRPGGDRHAPQRGWYTYVKDG
jgi:hypothetical protein